MEGIIRSVPNDSGEYFSDMILPKIADTVGDELQRAPLGSRTDGQVKASTIPDLETTVRLFNNRLKQRLGDDKPTRDRRVGSIVPLNASIRSYAEGPVSTFANTRVPPVGTFHMLSNWEGVVLERKGNRFLARLVDTEGSVVDKEAEFSIEELAGFDREMVEPGAVFYWVIGYSDTVFGMRQRVSQIRFRRLPVWDKSELEAAESNTDAIEGLFNRHPSRKAARAE